MKTTTLENLPELRLPVLLIVSIFLGSVWSTMDVAAAPGKLDPSSPAYPLKVSSNRRYLVDQNNTPFLIAGDVPQALVVTMASTAEAAVYFDDRQAHGFNACGLTC